MKNKHLQLSANLPVKQLIKTALPAILLIVTLLFAIAPDKLFAQAPAVTTFSPATGPVGTLVTISGTNLGAPTALTIGGQSAIVVSNTGSALVAMVMPGSATGAVTITTPGGTASGSGNFIITAARYPIVQQGSKLQGTGSVGSSRQGYSVSVSADGNTAMAGGYSDNTSVGAAWVYTRSGGTWVQQAELVGAGSSGASQQGSSVSLSADGNTAVVGGNNDDSGMGAAWVYTRSGGIWTQQGSKLVGTGSAGTTVYQGTSVSLSADGNTLIVGGFYDDSQNGAAWVYTRSGGTWAQQGLKLVGEGNAGAAEQGYSVSLSADGNTAIVGGYADNPLKEGLNLNQGAAWVYNRIGGAWTQQGSKLVGTDSSPLSEQGFSVSLSADGNTAIVGGIGNETNQGAAWVYTRSAGAWAQQGNALEFTDVDVGIAAVSLSADGNTAIVGGDMDNSGVGATWVYTRSGGTWTQQGSKLAGTGNSGAASQGQSISLSADGNTAIAGGYTDSSNLGAAWVFVAVPPPSINYVSPQIYAIGKAITALQPTSNGVVNAGYGSMPVVLGSGFSSPEGVAVDAAGNVYVADDGNSTVKKIPVGGGNPVIIGSGFSAPEGVAVDAAGNVYVGDVGNSAVYKIPAGGGAPVTLGSGFDSPYGVAVDAAGNVYVADQANDAVYKIPVGSNVPVVIGSGYAPFGVAVDAAGNVYVADYDNNVLKKIPVGGGAQVTVLSGLLNPTDVAVDAAGNIYVADGGHGIIKEIPVDGSAVIIASSGFINPVGVTTDFYGNLYVGEENGHAVKEIKPVGSYYLSAALPPGLSFSGSTGIISGIPTVISPAKNYVVTGYNAGGGSSATVNIAVTANANLSNLAISPGAIKPVFAGETTSYTASVANGVTSITVTPTAVDPAATIKVNGAAVTSGSTSQSLALKVGPNSITIKVTAQDGLTTITYTVTVTRAKSGNAALFALAISSGTLTPVFHYSTFAYTASVPNATSSIQVTPSAADYTATITVNGKAVPTKTASAPIQLTVGANIITVIATAQNGTSKDTYTITVTRLSNNANLSAFKISRGTLTPVFAATTTNYTATVANGVASMTVTPTSADPTATITVNGITVASASASQNIPLVVGTNTIKTIVTAQDGLTKKTYTLAVTRAPSSNNNLSALKISRGTLTPAFNEATTSYTASVVNGVTSMTVTPTTADPAATVKVRGTAVTSGTASAPIALSVGANTIKTIVTAANGTTKTYLLAVTRATSSADSFVPIAIGTGISANRPTEMPSLNDDGILVHQGISPNGDGANDFLTIENISLYPDNKLSIMNRNGQLIYEAEGYDNSSKVFDGHSNKNGQMQLPGTYFYQLDYTVKGILKRKTGFIVLKY